MSDIEFLCWKEIFLKALEETDSEKLARLVPTAELAIFKRQQELCDNPPNSEELSALCVASEALRVVKRRITKPESLDPRKATPRDLRTLFDAPELRKVTRARPS